MTIRTAEAEWRGNVQRGRGHIRIGSGAMDADYDFRSRMGEGSGSNPEEMLGAAHAGCFAMALASQLKRAGFTPNRIHATATVHFDRSQGSWTIHTIDLDAEATVPGMAAEDFARNANAALENCPMSRALKGVDIRVYAKLT
jgi:osmotically inducible protein OsmC